VRIGVYVVAIVLFGAPAIGASSAAEQRSGGRDIARSNLPAEPSGDRSRSRGGDRHQPADNGVGSKPEGKSDVTEEHAIRGETTPQSDARAGPRGDGIKTSIGVEDRSVPKDFRSSAVGGRATDAIDTRITVLPHRPDRKFDTVQHAGTKFKLGVRVSDHGRPLLQPGPPGLAPRNAIGLPIAQRGDVQRRVGGAQGLSEQIAKPSGLNIGPGRIGLSQTEPEFDRFNPARSATRPGLPAAAAKTGRINGTALIHPGATAFGVGGPTRAVAGINGSTITSKH